VVFYRFEQTEAGATRWFVCKLLQVNYLFFIWNELFDKQHGAVV